MSVAPRPLKRPRHEDAFTYLDEVKKQFPNKPKIHHEFLDIVIDLSSGRVKCSSIAKRIKHLFQGHVELTLGFCKFLPKDEKIKLTSEMRQHSAICYVTKVRNQFSREPDIYRQFLKVLHTYQKEQKGIKEVLEQVSQLFSEHPDLLMEFSNFLPDAVQDQAKERLHRAARESEACKHAHSMELRSSKQSKIRKLSKR